MRYLEEHELKNGTWYACILYDNNNEKRRLFFTSPDQFYDEETKEIFDWGQVRYVIETWHHL